MRLFRGLARLKMRLIGFQSGSAILNAVIGIAAISALSLAYANVYASVRQAQAKNDFLNTVSQIQLTIANTVNDANSWKATVGDGSHNSSMTCIASRNCTSAVAATSFVLWPASESTYASLSTAIYDGTSASRGFTLAAKPCSTFSLSGSADCPIHVTMKWSTTGCTPAPCDAPITVSINILYRPAGSSVFGQIDETRYTLSFLQASNTSIDPCAGSPPSTEVSLCATPPYSGDSLVCTGTGYRCGQVYK